MNWIPGRRDGGRGGMPLHVTWLKLEKDRHAADKHRIAVLEHQFANALLVVKYAVGAVQVTKDELAILKGD